MKAAFRLRALLALVLALCLGLTGCVGLMPMATIAPLLPSPSQSLGETAQTRPSQPEPEPDPTAPALPAPDEDYLIRWQNGGQKDFLPQEQIKLLPFDQMEYLRPDTESLYADFDALAAQAAEGADADSLLEGYYELYSRYISFYSMDTLANIRHSQNTQDPYYAEEYDFCEAETPKLEEKLEALYKAFAASSARRGLERAYFGRGYFNYYDDYEVYTNEEYLRLSQEEAALLARYRELTADVQVEYRGQTKALDEWLEAPDYETYVGALRAYYDQYNTSVGELFVELVRVRQQLAAALDYDSYADYSYEISYTRDYSPAQGEEFLGGIRRHLVPVLEAANGEPRLARLSYGSADEQSVKDMVRSAAAALGGTVWDAFCFMEAYALSDIAPSPVKVESSFQTYIYDYEAPFVLVNASGSGEDYTTFAHEFGHFTDAYYNYGANEDLETAETYSQAMEFLALCFSDSLSEGRRQSLLKRKLLDALETFVYQGAYAEFETRVYALDPERLSLETLNGLYRDCCKEYGVYEGELDFYYSKGWIDVIHFFEVPYYIISYCVSAETSLQVYELEDQSPGAGVEAYFRLLDRSYEAGVQQVMEDAALNNPFRDQVLEQTAAFFRQKLGLDQ